MLTWGKGGRHRTKCARGGNTEGIFAGVLTKKTKKNHYLGGTAGEPSAPVVPPAAAAPAGEEEEEEARFKGDLPLSFRRRAAGDACITICPVRVLRARQRATERGIQTKATCDESCGSNSRECILAPVNLQESYACMRACPLRNACVRVHVPKRKQGNHCECLHSHRLHPRISEPLGKTSNPAPVTCTHTGARTHTYTRHGAVTCAGV